MKKFEFRLDSVLRWRESQLQIERAMLSRFLGEELKLKLELEAITGQRREAVASLQNAERFETVELRALSAYLMGAAARESELHDQIARRQHLIATQRAQVLVAERNVKLLEKLREKRLDAWTADFHKHIDAAAEEAWLATHFGTAGSSIQFGEEFGQGDANGRSRDFQSSSSRFAKIAFSADIGATL